MLTYSQTEIPLVCLRPDGAYESPSTIGIVCRTIKERIPGFESFHFHALAQHGGVAFAGHVVQQDAGKTYAGFKGTQSVDKGGGRARHLGAVQGQENGRSQQAGHMGRGAGAAYVAAVEKSAVALNE